MSEAEIPTPVKMEKNTSPPVAFPGVRLSIYYAFTSAVIGINLPFWPIWASSRGLDASEIGIAISLGLGAKLLINPIAGHFADITGRRRTIMASLCFGALCAYGSFWFGHTFLTISLISMLFFGFLSPLVPLGENLTMMAVQNHGLQYGRIRLWGSLAFIVTSSGTGWVIAGRSPDLIYFMVMGLICLIFMTCFILPNFQTPRSETRKLTAFIVLSDKYFVVFLISISLIIASHSAFFAFGTLYWKSLGYSETSIGLMWAEGVIGEVILFMFAHRIMKYTGSIGLMMLGAIAGIIRWTIMAYATSLTGQAVVQVLHAFTFGASHLGAMYYISSRVGAHLSATAQGLYSSAVMGITLSIATLGSSYLYESHGGAVYLAMAGMSAVGLLVMLILMKMQKNHDHKTLFDQ